MIFAVVGPFNNIVVESEGKNELVRNSSDVKKSDSLVIPFYVLFH